MSLNSVISAERIHIGFFGLRNAGKSSLVNAVTAQRLSLVSDIKGTTTDPVKKAMELLPLGPVVIIDTPGLDDVGELGTQRVERAKQVLATTDIAVLVVDGSKGMSNLDKELKSLFEKRKLPYIIAMNKADLLGNIPESSENIIYVSAEKGVGISELKEKIAALAPKNKGEKKILSDIVKAGDRVILVTPIDSSAPKGRLILPQQQTIRELLEIGAITLIVQVSELQRAIDSLKNKPNLVITDSQAFGEVAAIVPEDVPLTSFSILFARYKGELSKAVEGAGMLENLRDGDKVLISGGCTHHRQCKDIGSVLLPGWIEKYSGKKLQFSFTSGGEFPERLENYALVVHCGGCMLTENEMKNRIERCTEKGVAITNYGIAIAEMKGILERSLEVFGKIE